MHLTTQEVPVSQLEPGMYISKLDIPWVQTPFPIQGFYIASQEDLKLLSHYCNKVYVDTFLSKVDVSTNLKRLSSVKKIQKNIDPVIDKLMKEPARFKASVVQYKNTRKLSKAMKQAADVYNEMSSQLAHLYRGLDSQGYVNLTEVHNSCQKMVKSIVANPNALVWLCRMRAGHGVRHQQAIRSAIWAMIFARHLGLSEEDLLNLGTALLLAPIGKCLLKDRLGSEPDKDANEFQEHIKLTLTEVEKMFSPRHQVYHILTAYCERHNASGYPNRLAGNRIPFLARVAGLADFYEALINPQDSVEVRTPVEAISELYSLRGIFFQEELVEAFIQAIGIYPTGSLVKLTDQQIAVVLEQPDFAKLRPTVAIIKDSNNNLLAKPKIIDLAKLYEKTGADAVKIEKSLRSTSADISANDVHEKLFAEKKWFNFLAS